MSNDYNDDLERIRGISATGIWADEAPSLPRMALGAPVSRRMYSSTTGDIHWVPQAGNVTSTSFDYMNDTEDTMDDIGKETARLRKKNNEQWYYDTRRTGYSQVVEDDAPQLGGGLDSGVVVEPTLDREIVQHWTTDDLPTESAPSNIRTSNGITRATMEAGDVITTGGREWIVTTVTDDLAGVTRRSVNEEEADQGI